MASQSSIKDRQKLFECSLCLSTFKTPKCLPCIHTFCLTCLDNYQQSCGDGELKCPLCRERFDVPSDGMSGLPSNFFIENIIEYEKDSVTQTEKEINSFLCDACSDSKDRKTAENFCPECNQNFCISCTSDHGRFRTTKFHSVIPIGVSSKTNSEARNNRVRFCDKHQSNAICLYCLQCDVVACLMCAVIEHSGHKCVAIKEASSKFRDQIDNALTKVTNQLKKAISTNTKLFENAEECVKNVYNNNKEHVKAKCDEIRKQLSTLEEELLSEAKEYRDDKLKEIESERDAREFQYTQLSDFILYLEQLKEKGSHCDIACSAQELVARGDHLVASSERSIVQKFKIVNTHFVPIGGFKLSKDMLGRILPAEKHIAVVGLHGSTFRDPKLYLVSLQQPYLRRPIELNLRTENLPAEICVESAACVVNNVIFAVGMGAKSIEIWKYEIIKDNWNKCINLCAPRRRHSVSFVNDKIYVIGGFENESKRVLGNILCYDINTNLWKKGCKLKHAVQSSCSVVFDSKIYIFGGMDEQEADVDYIQIYDSATNTVSLSNDKMPKMNRLQRGVLWKTKVLLVSGNNCFIYDLESNVWEERTRFKVGFSHFGLTLDGNVIYTVGGGTSKRDQNNGTEWVFSDEIKYLSVEDFLSNNPEAKWKVYAKLPRGGLVSSYSSIPLMIY